MRTDLTKQARAIKAQTENKISSLINIGAKNMKMYVAKTGNAPTADSGVFVGVVEPWSPKKKYEVNDLFSYEGNLGYVKQAHTAQETWIPFTQGTESLYGARPKPDSDGIYPYVYNMGIFKNMRVRGNDGMVYKSISGTYENPTELLYPPEDVAALFVKEE